ncbi:restriction endonuclease [Lentibacillus sp. CBA3610]|uniref:restriction endonuclease n=1 Tax=Lentibacillus sp. CBA3610 TaxID=2518176 RepID=UPI001594FC38|nr:restriction endonuclease [Lentibacillus sp. CBA3610]QKY71355.1 restriction endonuclease [Lentibacillus sp. CBA3610]
MNNLLFFFSAMLIVLLVLPLIIKYVRKKKRFNLMKKSGIRDIDRMKGYQFEVYLQVLFKELGYRPVVTQKSGDYGADVVLKGKNKIVIQAKRYGYRHNVSMDAVREVLAAMFFYQADEAWVITNSFFTKQAKTLANVCGVKLLNRYELEKFIVKINPTKQPKQFTRKRSELS